MRDPSGLSQVTQQASAESYTPSASGKWWGAGILALAFVPRAVIGIVAPSSVGDGGLYLRVAENILRNGCVSISDPLSGACVPHWGGNHLPGYPAFIAVVRGLLPEHPAVLPLVQALVVSAAITYFAHAAARLTRTGQAAYFAAALLALSPGTIAWVRLTLTESLVLAVSIWIAAEIARSLDQRRLRVVPLALALAAAAFLRYDAILLVLPVAIAAFAIHGTREAIRRGLFVLVLVSLPLGAWWMRSVQAGLPIVPQSFVTQDGWRAPEGYYAWWKGWIVHQYTQPAVVFAAYGGHYDRIRVPDAAFANEAERAVVESLLAELQGYVGREIPEHIDRQFAELASAKRRDHLWHSYVWLPLVRSAIMWANPFDSGGWPAQVDGGVRNEALGGGLLAAIAGSPGSAAVKASVTAYRALLAIAVLTSLVWAIRSRTAWLRVVVIMAISYTVARTVFVAELGLVETRYLVGAFPFLEIAAMMTLGDFLRSRRERRQSPVRASGTAAASIS